MMVLSKSDKILISESSGEGMQEAVIARIRSRLKKFEDIGSVVRKRVVSLKLQGSLYKSCVRSALLCHDVEC